MSAFRSLSYKKYLSDGNIGVPRETKRRRQQTVEDDGVRQRSESTETTSAVPATNKVRILAKE